MEKLLETFLTLRQQSQKTKGAPNMALADFIAPKDSGKADYMGAFCVTTGFGVDERAEEFEKQSRRLQFDYGKSIGRSFCGSFCGISA